MKNGLYGQTFSYRYVSAQTSCFSLWTLSATKIEWALLLTLCPSQNTLFFQKRNLQHECRSGRTLGISSSTMTLFTHKVNQKKQYTCIARLDDRNIDTSSTSIKSLYTLKVAIYAVIVSDIFSYMYSIPKLAVFPHG